MKKKNIPAAVASTNAYEALEDWARSRVQVWLQELLEEEVTQFLGREKSERSPNRRGYRNGHGKPRRFAMMNGTLEVRRPRVRNTAERFESQILPYFRRKSKQLGELLPDLYLHGLATGDFEQAMRGLLGAGAPLSRASIQRLKSTWQLEYDEVGPAGPVRPRGRVPVGSRLVRESGDRERASGIAGDHRSLVRRAQSGVGL